MTRKARDKRPPKSSLRSPPPSRVKLYNAFRKLLEEKGFNAITTAEIAETASVNEALIFRYFKNKRGLLYQILADDFVIFQSGIRENLKGIKGAGNKLRKLIWSHINYLDNNRVFARILLLEITNFPDYFESAPFKFIRAYGKIVLELIEEGIKSGELRDDISPSLIREMIFGSIHHLCLLSVAHNKKIAVDAMADDLFEAILDGITQNK